MVFFILTLVAASVLARFSSISSPGVNRDYIKIAKTMRAYSRIQAKPSPRELVADILNHAGYAAVAYCNEVQREASNRNTRMLKSNTALAHIFSDEGSATQALVFVNTHVKEIVISFRGSHDITKFADMMTREKVDYPSVEGAQVHRDAFKVMESIKDHLIEALANEFQTHPDYWPVIVGHSYGGSLATLMAPILAEVIGFSPQGVRVITYNQPRVGNRAFAEHYNSLGFNFTRVTNKNDPVHDHPLVRYDWAHVHQEVYIDEKDDFYLCNTTMLEDVNCSSNRANRIKDLTHHGRIGKTIISPKGCFEWEFLFD